MIDIIIAAVAKAIQVIYGLIAEAMNAKTEQHQAILDRINAAQAAAAGERTAAHQETDAELVAARAELAQIKADHVALQGKHATLVAKVVDAAAQP